jgi:biotin carboxylase
MKKILILGTGNAQVDFIKLCKEFGLYVYACSYKNEGRGIAYANEFALINITDFESVKQFVLQNKIDYLYSTGSDIALPTIANVAEELNLPRFISYNTAVTCNNKTLLRKSLSSLKDGKYSVKHKKISTVDDIHGWNIFPAIIKPVDSQGQRGITTVYNTDDISKAVDIALSNSISKAAIIEEFVEGFEISVNSYVVDNKPIIYFITERHSFEEYPGGIIKSHLYPTVRNVNELKVRELVDDIAQYLEISNGPMYFQIKIDKHQNPKLIEVTPRFDGCHLWRLIKTLGGPDLLSMSLKHLTSQNLNIDDIKNNQVKNVTAQLSFFTQPPHTQMSRSGFCVNSKTVYSEWYYDDDEIIRPINNHQEKVGYEIILND